MRVWRHERDVEKAYVELLEEMHRRYHERPQAAAEGEKLRHNTTDACPGVGDDTPHEPLLVYLIPDFVASRATDVGGDHDALIDLIFINFIEVQVIRMLNDVQMACVCSRADTSVYSAVRSNEVLGLYAEVAWN